MIRPGLPLSLIQPLSVQDAEILCALTEGVFSDENALASGYDRPAQCRAHQERLSADGLQACAKGNFLEIGTCRKSKVIDNLKRIGKPDLMEADAFPETALVNSDKALPDHNGT